MVGKARQKAILTHPQIQTNVIHLKSRRTILISKSEFMILGALRSRTPGPRTEHRAHPGTRTGGHALKNHAKKP